MSAASNVASSQRLEFNPARLEGEIALSSLVRRMPRMELELDTPPRRPGLVLRGLSSLPVRF